MKRTFLRKWIPLYLGFNLFALLYPFGMASTAADLPFDDISNSYARNQILDLYRNHVVNGTTARTFEPDKPIMRAEFITMLERALHIQPVNSAIPAFSDVSPKSWYYGAVQAGLELGIIEGTSPTRFEPDKLITRQEASALLIRALKQQVNDNLSIVLPFNDSVLVSSWAIPYVDAAQRLELMVGDGGSFRPNQPITRQETAVVIDKLFTEPRWTQSWNAATPASLIQMGWQYNETTAEFEQKILQSTVNTVSPRWFFVEKDFSVKDASDASIVSWAKQHNKKIWPLVGNHFDQQTTHQLLSQPDKAASAIQQLSTYVQHYELDGLNIDFENVAPGDRDLLSSFIFQLANELHAHGKTLTVNVSPDRGTDWTEAFDYAALGKSADYIVLMAYDEHWDGDEVAGSVSSLPWFTSGIDKLMSLVPANKVIVALPFYTQDWTIDKGIVANQELAMWQQNEFIAANGIVPIWDPNVGQYTTNYTLDNRAHTIWLEDSRSIAMKFQAAISAKAAGTAYWYIGGESPDVWASLGNRMKYNSVASK